MMKVNNMYRSLLLVFTLCVTWLASASILQGEDGYRLWLKYDSLSDQSLIMEYQRQVNGWYVTGNDDTASVIKTELRHALSGLLGKSKEVDSLNNARFIVSELSLLPKEIIDQLDVSGLGASQEGYVLQEVNLEQNTKLVLASRSSIGTLYGVYHLLRIIQTQSSLEKINITSSPMVDVRVLNHWDNPDRHVERGYAGQSIWDWHKLPTYIHQQYHDYARANASIGINGTVLNNVNAHPIMLTKDYLHKAAALAAVFRPYGLKVYLSVKYSSPQTLGGLSTSDPLDEDVQAWWAEKTNEIYSIIPDFGGFLVKADSEGQPGPGDYGRSHAVGANMLADALAPHGGIVMWRAFVYASDKQEERSKQAYSEFVPLDGEFRDNVLLQVKNGPIDFQPREPFSPLFGAMKETPVMMEFQITQEYLGFSTHSVYLGPMYEEVLQADTFAKGTGSTVAKVVDGTLFDNTVSGIAGVSNIGSDRNWTGNIMLQANWYVFGRLAWDHGTDVRAIANDWIRMTLTNVDNAVDTIEDMMMSSHEATVNYMTPLGLHHIMGEGHHYGPAPWVKDLPRPEWTSVYYHNADANGIGFNRSPSGVNAVAQYYSPLKESYSSPYATPEEYLLWFHHLPWDFRIASTGRPLWEELVHRYYQGAEDVAEMAIQWKSVQPWIDPLQFKQVSMSLEIHQSEAKWWRDACVLYFQSFSQLPIPETLTPPDTTLEQLKLREFPFAPGRGD